MLGPDALVFSSTPVARVPFLDRLKPVRAAGFDGISIQPQDVSQLEDAGIGAGELKARVADSGLAIAEMDCIATWLPQHFERTDTRFGGQLLKLTPDRVIPSAARVGARSVTIAEIYGVTPSTDEAASVLAPICRKAADEGLIVHLEFAPFGGIKTLTQAIAIVEATGCANAALTIDSWHFFQGGSTLAQLGQVSGARIGSVQLNDGVIEPADDPLTACMTRRRLPGEGAFDLVGLVRTLDRIGSTAPIGIEVFTEELPTQSIEKIARDWGRTTRNIVEKAREKT